MSIKQRKFFAPVLFAILVVGTLTLVVARSRSNRNGLPTPEVSSLTFLPSQTKSSTQVRGPQNLSLQPEAFNMARRLGQRFAAAKREKSIQVGTLTIGSYRRVIQTTRTQTDIGERVEIAFIDTTGSLAWDASRGVLSGGVEAAGSERELIERMVFDSPDQALSPSRTSKTSVSRTATLTSGHPGVAAPGCGRQAGSNLAGRIQQQAVGYGPA